MYVCILLKVLDTPSHFLIGSKIFLAASENFRLANCYVAKRGYYASLKSCTTFRELVCVCVFMF